MATEQQDDKRRRTRGPSKPYPVIPFEEALELPRNILEHGVQGEIQRLTLLDTMGITPTSSKTRTLITSSAKYGMTVGSFNASSLSVTDDGKVLFDSSSSPAVLQRARFRAAIAQFDPFKSVYEKLSGNRFRDANVIGDELVQAGIAEGDREAATEIFEANLRFTGLVKDVSGSDYVMTMDDITGHPPRDNPEIPAADTDQQHRSHTPIGSPTVNGAAPSVHLDIQIHIDSTASSDQIDQIFASMAKHLYGKDG